MQTKHWRVWAAGAAIMGLSLGVAATASAKTLVFCSEGSPEGFNPQLYTSGTTFDAAGRTIFDRLVEFKRGETTIQPGLAESWDISEDGTVYTFHLREGVQFHDTEWFTPSREFNADDVLYTFRRQLNDDHPWHDVGGSYQYFNAMGMGELIEQVEKVDEHTVRFHLSRPEAPFLADMAMDFASIHSKEYADQLMEAGATEQMNQQPVGTGPFQFVAYQKDAFIRYTAHPEYWRGKAALDRLVFAITPDASVRYQKLKAGECHVMPYPNPADIEDMKADDEINVLSQPGLNIGYLAFNTQKEPFDDARVRRALNMAVNKDAIIDAVYQGAGQPAKNPIPPTMWSYNESVEDYPYDPEKARKLLEEAGVDSLETNIWAMPVQRPYNPNARRMAEMIQADWAEVGVDAQIVSYEWGEYLRRSGDGEHDTVLMGWTGDNGDPDNFLYTLLSCSARSGPNRAKWCHEPFEKLIEKAKASNDKDERTRLYEQAQAVFKKQAPWLTIAHSVVHEPVRKEVKNYKVVPFGTHIFYGVDLEE